MALLIICNESRHLGTILLGLSQLAFYALSENTSLAENSRLNDPISEQKYKLVFQQFSLRVDYLKMQ